MVSCPSRSLGLPGAGRMMRAGRTRQRFRSPLFEEPNHAQPLGAELREVELRRAGARDDDEVDAVRQQIRVGSKALTAQALHPVSLHGAANPATHDQPEPGRSGLTLGRDEQREVRRSYTAGVAARLRARELCVLAEPAIGAEGHHLRSGPRPGRRRQAAAAYFL
jgi:hypothetical protein